MHSQTIALFRYLMLGILGRRFYLLVGILVLVAVLAASFLAELAIINGAAIVAAFVAGGDITRKPSTHGLNENTSRCILPVFRNGAVVKLLRT